MNEDNQQPPIIYPNPPMPEVGMPPSEILAHLKFYGENESIRQEGDRVTGDIPATAKLKLFALTNKNVVNANLTEREIDSLKRKVLRLKMFNRMFTQEDKLSADEILAQEQIFEIDFTNRLSQSREGFGTKQRTTMTNVHLQGSIDQRGSETQPKPKWM